MTTTTEDVFYDRDELLKAMASPEYAASSRYRDEIAAKLHRSSAAGTIAPMGEEITRQQRNHERIAVNTPEGMYGDAVPYPSADPHWVQAANVGVGCFKSPEEVAAAFSAPAFESDPTYQAAAREKVARSMREGWLTADLKSANPHR